jgi:hypothetical protein
VAVPAKLADGNSEIAPTIKDRTLIDFMIVSSVDLIKVSNEVESVCVSN